jgi:hypothetical protein
LLTFFRKCAQDIKTPEQNEVHQRKLDDIAKLSTQANVNLQNELLKSLIFSDTTNELISNEKK